MIPAPHYLAIGMAGDSLLSDGQSGAVPDFVAEKGERVAASR